jgi:hypothetical protein
MACTVFVIALQAGESLRVGYQLLVDMTVIVYFIPFLYMFAASWKCGRKWSAGMGLVVTIVSIVVSLIPPGDVRSVWLFEFKLLAGCAVLIVAARVIFKFAQGRRDAAG